MHLICKWSNGNSRFNENRYILIQLTFIKQELVSDFFCKINKLIIKLYAVKLKRNSYYYYYSFPTPVGIKMYIAHIYIIKNYHFQNSYFYKPLILSVGVW